MEENEKRECACKKSNEKMNTCGCGNDDNKDMYNHVERDECEREQMLMEIREINFAVIELGLYLNTHPEDQRALCLHRKYVKELKDLKDKYQKVYGPLSIYYPCNKWRWLEEPWAWFILEVAH